jgi:hypothetical protein
VARRRAMCRARAVPQLPSRRDESSQVDTRACRGCAHPSALGPRSGCWTTTAACHGVAWHRRGLVSTPYAASFISGIRPSRRAVLFLAGLRACGVGQAKRTPAQTRVAVYTATPCAWWPAEQNCGLLAVRGRRGVPREAVELVTA